ncbi:MAG TPA: outer membrane lipoprotein carrier protein LolA [Rhizomicrobium sp.]|nr:outer membrane lipoprotein carrier protein LolA [Rhizomicrobium sp.]
MRIFSVLALFTALLIGAPGQAANFKPQDAAELDRISAALNGIHSLKGDFVQIDPNGQIEQGQLYIQKPGKMRFEYQPPSATVVVSDGIDVAVFNKKLNTADRYPLSTTPLNILLSDHVNLRQNKYVVGIEHRSGEIVVSARSNDRRMTGNITIVFSDPGLELRQWTVVDAQGLATTVTLRNIETGVSLQSVMFLTHG